MYSIYEFAAKLAGMNCQTVDAILNVDKNLEGKPTNSSRKPACPAQRDTKGLSDIIGPSQDKMA